MNTDKPVVKPPFPVIATIIAFMAVVIMVGLGFWQLERKVEKEQRLLHIENAQQQQSIALSQVVDSPNKYQDFTAMAKGRLQNKAFYIDNKIRNGVAGFHVLLPLQTDLGTLMVNLGWLAGTGVRNELPGFSLHKEFNVTTTLSGVVYLPLDNRLIKETNMDYGRFPAMLQQVDLDEIEQHLEGSLLPFVLRLVPNDNSSFVRDWEVITMSPDKHLGYAIQWFGLAIAGLTIYLLSLVKRMQGPHAKNNN